MQIKKDERNEIKSTGAVKVPSRFMRKIVCRLRQT